MQTDSQTPATALRSTGVVCDGGTYQAKQQRALREAGKCVRCWKEAEGGVECKKCRMKRKARIRKRDGCKAWKKGGRGRPPIVVRSSHTDEAHGQASAEKPFNGRGA